MTVPQVKASAQVTSCLGIVLTMVWSHGPSQIATHMYGKTNENVKTTCQRSILRLLNFFIQEILDFIIQNEKHESEKMRN